MGDGAGESGVGGVVDRATPSHGRDVETEGHWERDVEAVERSWNIDIVADSGGTVLVTSNAKFLTSDAEFVNRGADRNGDALDESDETSKTSNDGGDLEELHFDLVNFKVDEDICGEGFLYENGKRRCLCGG